MSSSRIELEQVSRAYHPGAAALAALNLEIAAGERLAVLGPSGSGKTTLLRLIAGLETPDQGTIRIGGRDVADVPPHHRDAAMVFQNPALYPHLRVRENIAFGLRAQGLSRAERAQRVAAVARLLDIEGLLDRRPAELSGGERQRVALSRALVREPKVLLLDEPFSSLDQPLRVALRRELIELHHRYRSTLVYVTHDQEEALAIGQRLAILRQGRLIQVDTPRNLYERPEHQFVGSFLGSPGMNMLEAEITYQDTNMTLALCGVRFPLRPPAPSLAAASPRRLVLGIRPEAVALLAAAALPEAVAPGRPTLDVPAAVLELEFRGHATLVRLQAGEARLVALVPVHDPLRVGQRVLARLELEHASWFDPSSGSRVELHCQPTRQEIA